LQGIDDVTLAYTARHSHRIDAIPCFSTAHILRTEWSATTLENQEFADVLVGVFALPAIVELVRQAAIAIKPVSHG